MLMVYFSSCNSATHTMHPVFYLHCQSLQLPVFVMGSCTYGLNSGLEYKPLVAETTFL
jgi:hypothetical protein